MELSDLRNKYEGKDIFVVGNGRTLFYYPDDFFKSQDIVLFCNKSITKFYGNLNSRKYWIYNDKELLDNYAEEVKKRLSLKNIVAKSRNECGECYTFGWLSEPREILDFTNDLYHHGSVAHNATHLAAYMGAKKIILVGIDMGWLGDKYYWDNKEYKGETAKSACKYLEVHHWTGWWILRNELKKIGISIVSMSPFLGINYKMDFDYFEHR